ncbi:DHA2 family efflux MFS transporter permease subunit [Paenibacillus phoenicis]|uniref:DHA2 family efflux MFS transporter permease subunit n=1 Tax=Paenibacillus phoenicis TaxID=554117 RepID=A0ABU5PEZ3_9BACL|nr:MULTISPECIES: DHA2 family efflux MFS transporter permease subunit [Paenibacillus]EES73585.1 drug resistance MFS transporter, drug:H+ antiporter-2 family [Paenibacillus sp. oral taxon 786 str. D14]MEA3568407.1 DHA2 family efflux MFS transporter permease subunit [Paenibacillus phoenicis]
MRTGTERRFWPILLTLFLGSFAGVYHVVSLNVSLPGFIGIFHAELNTVQWVITGFSLACGMIAPVSGYVCLRFGSKRVFLWSLAGISVTSLLCAISWNVQALIGFRILQGVFCGLIQPVSLMMIYQTLPRERQPLAVSVWSFSTVLATAIGPSLSGWFQQVDWHLIFLVTVPLGIGAWIAAKVLLPSAGGADASRKLDIAGLFLATGGSLAMLLLFGNLHQWGLASPLTWACLIAGGAAFVMFVRVELRTPEPLLNLRLFRNLPFTASLSLTLILTVALYSGVYFIPLFLEEIRGMSAFHIGLLFLPAAACLTLATFLSGKIYASRGPALLVGAGSLLLLAANLHFSRLHPETTLLSVIIWLCIRNAGTGFALTPATGSAMGAVSEQESGDASALLSWLRQIVSSISLGMFTSVFYVRLGIHEARMHAELNANGLSREQLYREAYTQSIGDAFWLASGLIAAAIPLVWLIRRKRQPQDAGAPALKRSV